MADKDNKSKNQNDSDVDTEGYRAGKEPIRDHRPARDPYTGEPIPPDEIPNIPISEQSFADETEDMQGDEDEALDFLAIERGADDDEVMDLIDDYTDDPQILSDFAERQNFTGGSDELRESLENYTGRGPDLTGEDLDAAWDMIDVSGEEGVGGSVVTPDQDIVEELGEAHGITYDDDEELNTLEKLQSRDEDRFELDPESQDIESEDDFLMDEDDEDRL
ncbi:MAG: hypothetical protein EHM41_06300 [Chloroflexi bacterium]|nr:MAG: hypothetical protein EHM41_06300 [Chloroflexota bacterium]